MVTQLTNNAAESATYSYNGGTPYITLSGTALSGYQSLLSLATNDSWADGDFIWIFIREDANKWSIWKSVWDETNERLLSSGGTIEEESGTLTDSGTVSVYGVVSKGTLAEQYREKLTADRTYYVRTDGSDSNTGLANTSGGAFLTINKATEVVGTLDILNYDVTIQIADGTYTITAGIKLDQPCGTGNVILLGNETTPANVVITTSAALTSSSSIGGMIYGAQSTAVSFHIRGIKLTSTTSSGACFGIVCNDGFSVSFQNVDFGAFTSGASTRHIHCDDGSTIAITGNYTISGGAAQHAVIARTATMFGQSVTVTITGTPAFSSTFVFALFLAVISLSSITYSGSATGVRYLVSSNSVINTAGGGANYFPGDSAGSATTGGQYV